MASKDDLLALLNSHCQHALGDAIAGPSTLQAPPAVEDEDEDEDEWRGIEPSLEEDSAGSDGEDDMNDDEFTFGSAAVGGDHSSTTPLVTVFSESYSSKGDSGLSKAQMKAFMSSKVSKLRHESTNDNQRPKSKQEADEDRNNAYNDALLHRMVHTKLLSGSLSEDVSQKPAARRKALEGRLLELAGSSKLGRGENSVRKDERNKASSRVRKGLQDKVQERRKAKLEEAKDLGNYHRSLKRVYEDEDANRPKKKRDRGLSMGVGRFSGGVLKLSKSDIAKAQGTSARGRPGPKKGKR